MTRQSGNVAVLGRMKCPVGSYAKHATHGICEILDARDRERLVGYEEHVPDEIPDLEDLPEGVLAEEVLASEKIVWREAWVDIDALSELNPKLDVQDGPRGNILAFSSRSPAQDS